MTQRTCHDSVWIELNPDCTGNEAVPGGMVRWSYAKDNRTRWQRVLRCVLKLVTITAEVDGCRLDLHLSRA